MRLFRLKTVVLPAPLGPISVNTSPRRTSKLTSLTATTPPKRTPRWRAARSGAAIGVVTSFQPVGLEEALLPLEHALAVERKDLEIRAQLQPATIKAERLEQHEGDQDEAVHRPLQPRCLADHRRQEILGQ